MHQIQVADRSSIQAPKSLNSESSIARLDRTKDLHYGEVLTTRPYLGLSSSDSSTINSAVWYWGFLSGVHVTTKAKFSSRSHSACSANREVLDSEKVLSVTPSFLWHRVEVYYTNSFSRLPRSLNARYWTLEQVTSDVISMACAVVGI